MQRTEFHILREHCTKFDIFGFPPMFAKILMENTQILIFSASVLCLQKFQGIFYTKFHIGGFSPVFANVVVGFWR